jgi:putative membrane protein
VIDADSRFDVQPSVGNHFAWMRTLLGLQRTLMAAVRTAVSLIGFGFTVAQFFEKMRDKVPEGMRATPINVPRDLGLLLIGAGVVSLIIFTAQYHMAVAYLRSGDFDAIAAEEGKSLHRPTYLVAWTVIIIGIAAFASVLLRF